MAFDNSFWALVALVIFLVVVAYFGVPAMINKALDARSAKIRQDIDEAHELKEEAKRQLAEYLRRRREAEAEAQQIVDSAHREAEAIRAEAKRKSEDYVARRTASAESKIALAESEAIADVRASAVDIAVAAATKLIADRSAGGEAAAFTAKSLEELRSRLN